MKILLLDVCGTITKDNTTIDFFKKNNVHISFFERVVGSIVWRVFKNDFTRKKYISKLNKKPVNEIRNLAKIYVENLIFEQRVMRRVSALRIEGYKVILATATIEPIAQEIANKIGADDFICSTLTEKDGLYTGEIDLDLLDNKIGFVINKYRNFNDYQTFMISDNYGDLSLMKMCNRSLAVSRSPKGSIFWSKNNVDFLELL